MKFKHTPYKRPAGEDQSKLGTTWADVEGMIRQRAFPKRAGLVLGILVAVVLALIGIGTWNVHRISSLASNLRSQSIANCENNDAFRRSQIAIWKKNYALQAQENRATANDLAQLVSVLAHNDPAEIKAIYAILAKSNSASGNEVTTFLNYVKTQDEPKNCKALYSS